MTKFFTAALKDGYAAIGINDYELAIYLNDPMVSPAASRDAAVLFSFDDAGNLLGVCGHGGLATTAVEDLAQEARLHHLAFNFTPPASHMRAYRVTPANPDDREDIAWGWDCDHAAGQWLAAHPGHALSASCLWEPRA